MRADCVFCRVLILLCVMTSLPLSLPPSPLSSPCCLSRARAGTRLVGTGCGQDTYQSLSGSSSCVSCPEGTSTYDVTSATRLISPFVVSLAMMMLRLDFFGLPRSCCRGLVGLVLFHMSQVYLSPQHVPRAKSVIYSSVSVSVNSFVYYVLDSFSVNSFCVM